VALAPGQAWWRAGAMTVVALVGVALRPDGHAVAGGVPSNLELSMAAFAALGGLSVLFATGHGMGFDELRLLLVLFGAAMMGVGAVSMFLQGGLVLRVALTFLLGTIGGLTLFVVAWYDGALHSPFVWEQPARFGLLFSYLAILVLSWLSFSSVLHIANSLAAEGGAAWEEADGELEGITLILNVVLLAVAGFATLFGYLETAAAIAGVFLCAIVLILLEGFGVEVRTRLQEHPGAIPKRIFGDQTVLAFAALGLAAVVAPALLVGYDLAAPDATGLTALALVLALFGLASALLGRMERPLGQNAHRISRVWGVSLIALQATQCIGLSGLLLPSAYRDIVPIHAVRETVEPYRYCGKILVKLSFIEEPMALSAAIRPLRDVEAEEPLVITDRPMTVGHLVDILPRRNTWLAHRTDTLWIADEAEASLCRRWLTIK